ncbi:TolC family protein [Colwellia sp. MSW7]|uniref:TolC family protein n=1 Tax=Colwellia maritima TaxID=2912588 RepID=A0ABS9WZS8_9GAMM|nr:TolC family protein [Colwellia maritima]MCI2283505.1 TolC family protein [Colwellia maritima]
MMEHHIKSKFHLKCGIGILAVLLTPSLAAQQALSSVERVLSFEQAIKSAQKNDPWATGNIHQQSAIESMSSVANTLPDPKVTISLANLPTNGFDFAQEGMTQAKIGIAQMFPRGDTLAIKSRQLSIESEAFPFQRKNREAKVAVTVGSLWLDAYRVQQSIALIEKNRSLFEQLADVAQASYSSALGKTRQQDIVRAQAELTRLEDRLEKLAQQQNQYQGMLSQWLTKFATSDESAEDILLKDIYLHDMVLSQQLPQIGLFATKVIDSQHWLKAEQLVHYFSKHPSVLAIDKKVSATKAGIQLAEQKYQPEWGVSASYGYRADDPMGRSRADLFSVGVTFDLPLFTENKQDQEVQSAIFQTEAVKTEKLLLLRQLLGSYSSAKGRLQRLKARQALYKAKLLPQIHDQAEASLTAYTNDDGDFAEVVRARIAVLNAEIDELALDVEEQKLHLELNYLFLGSVKGSIKGSNNGSFKPVTMDKHNDTNSSQYIAIVGEK